MMRFSSHAIFRSVNIACVQYCIYVSTCIEYKSAHEQTFAHLDAGSPEVPAGPCGKHCKGPGRRRAGWGCSAGAAGRAAALGRPASEEPYTTTLPRYAQTQGPGRCTRCRTDSNGTPPPADERTDIYTHSTAWVEITPVELHFTFTYQHSVSVTERWYFTDDLENSCFEHETPLQCCSETHNGSLVKQEVVYIYLLPCQHLRLFSMQKN